MHLNDSLGKHPKLSYIIMFHENAAAIAAEDFSKLRNDIVVAIVRSLGISFIPEVWQGLKAHGAGFWFALDCLGHTATD